MSALAEYGPHEMRVDVIEMAAALRARTTRLTAGRPVDAEAAEAVEAVERLRQAYHGLLLAADLLGPAPGEAGVS